jgi:cysteine desulfurase / selenocysteine lyase
MPRPVRLIHDRREYLVPWQLLAQRKRAHLRYIDVDEQGRLKADDFAGILTERTKLVSLGHVSNALGTINPVHEMVAMARERAVPVLVDAAQAVQKLPVDVQALGCDFLVFSGHKIYGPSGVGALWGRAEHLEAMEPYQTGGEMISNVTFEHTEWNEIPYKFEAGTPNLAQAVGMGAAIEYLESLGMDNIREHEKQIAAHALRRLDEVGATVYGPTEVDDRGAVCAFTIPGVHPHDLATILDQDGICIRAGHHCAQPLMRRLGVPATARASFYLYNTAEEVDALGDALDRAKGWFA